MHCCLHCITPFPLLIFIISYSSSSYHLCSMPRIELSTPWTSPTTPIKIYGDVKNMLDVQPPNSSSIDLYSRPLHRQHSEKLIQQRYRYLQSSEHEIRPEAPLNLAVTNKKKPQMSINKPRRHPEQQQNLVCPSPKTPQFNVQFLKKEDSVHTPVASSVPSGVSQVKTLLDTSRGGSRSVLGRKFPKCTGTLCNMR